MGALNLKLPESLHTRARKLAEREGIPLNQFVLLALAEKTALLEVGASSPVSADLAYLEARARRGREHAAAEGKTARQVLGELLDRVPDIEPDTEDRLPE